MGGPSLPTDTEYIEHVTVYIDALEDGRRLLNGRFYRIDIEVKTDYCGVS